MHKTTFRSLIVVMAVVTILLVAAAWSTSAAPIASRNIVMAAPVVTAPNTQGTPNGTNIVRNVGPPNSERVVNTVLVPAIPGGDQIDQFDRIGAQYGVTWNVDPRTSRYNYDPVNSASRIMAQNVAVGEQGASSRQVVFVSDKATFKVTLGANIEIGRDLLVVSNALFNRAGAESGKDIVTALEIKGDVAASDGRSWTAGQDVACAPNPTSSDDACGLLVDNLDVAIVPGPLIGVVVPGASPSAMSSGLVAINTPAVYPLLS